MAENLIGKRIAFLVANEGVEQVELTRPWKPPISSPSPLISLSNGERYRSSRPFDDLRQREMLLTTV